jgi:Ca2+-binding EF-hand superfamily protein
MDEVLAEEFDRLDKDKKGELDAQELLRSNLVVKHARPEDAAGDSGA